MRRKSRSEIENERSEIENEIVSWVRREMDKPRLTESVRQALIGHAAVAIEKPAPGVWAFVR